MSDPTPVAIEPRRYLKDRLAVLGIPLTQAEAHGFVPLDREQAKKLFPDQPIGPGIGFIYDEADGTPGSVHRIRELPSLSPKARRYVSKVGGSSRIYFPRVPSRGINWKAAIAGSIERLIITEGELKALACCLAGEYAVGIGGVTMWTDKNGKLHPQLRAVIKSADTVIVIFDSDARTNKKVHAQFNKLLAALRMENKRAYGIVVPAKPDEKIGIDDYLFAEGPKKAADRLAVLIEFELGRNNELLDALNEKWKFIKDPNGSRVVEIEEDGRKRVLSVSSFNDGQERALVLQADGKSKLRRISEWWTEQEGKSTYKGTVLHPFTSAPPNGRFNLYTPLAKPDVVPNIAPLYQLLASVWGKDGLMWLRALNAYYFQNEGPAGWKPLLIGREEGTGKTMSGRIYLAPLGYRYMKLGSSIESLMAPFGMSVCEEHLGLQLEEGVRDDNSGRKAREFLKKLTEPMLEIERKGIDRYTIPNLHQFYFSANSSRLIHLDANDRRFYVKQVPNGFKLDDKLRQQCNQLLYGSQNYNAPIREDVSWALRRDAMRYRIPSSFDPGRAPHTEEKLWIVASDRSAVEEEVHQLATSGTWCGSKVGEVVMPKALVLRFNTAHPNEKLREGTLRHLLREHGFRQVRVHLADWNYFAYTFHWDKWGSAKGVELHKEVSKGLLET